MSKTCCYSAAEPARPAPEEIAGVWRRALAVPGLIDSSDSAVIFHDLSFMAGRCRAIKQAFPANALHTVAVKANPLAGVLRAVAQLDMGLEAASLAELHLALASGVPPSRIVFDSPVKTMDELAFALAQGVHVNADSLPELARIAELLRDRESASVIGLRVNPQVGAGVIQQTGVAGEYSKFGVPLTEQADEVFAAFARYPWLRALHVHVGSQGCPLPLLVRGVSAAFTFAQEINRRLAAHGRRIGVFDLGGGLPVCYRDDQPQAAMADYARALRQAIPELFTGDWRIISEFGRFAQANAGWVASRIEYVKDGEPPTIAVHVGADLFLRRCYRPDDWHHDLFVCDASGRMKTGHTRHYAVAGPLCFAGDLLARRVALPEAASGDFLLIRDAGAYTLSMWSRYNSRQMPKVIGYDGDAFTLLRRRESLAELAAFWGA
jgi:diaminopimelate decarboxylase